MLLLGGQRAWVTQRNAAELLFGDDGGTARKEGVSRLWFRGHSALLMSTYRLDSGESATGVLVDNLRPHMNGRIAGQHSQCTCISDPDMY
jgi:hypothetical protein